MLCLLSPHYVFLFTMSAPPAPSSVEPPAKAPAPEPRPETAGGSKQGRAPPVLNMSQFLSTSAFSDCNLKYGEKVYKCHRLVLCSFSRVCYEYYNAEPVPAPEMQVPPLPAEVVKLLGAGDPLQAVLSYCYTSPASGATSDQTFASASEELLLGALAFAVSLDMPRLVKDLSSRICSTSPMALGLATRLLVLVTSLVGPHLIPYLPLSGLRGPR
jgi:hypothetical protein